jgi:IS30 family transposase
LAKTNYGYLANEAADSANSPDDGNGGALPLPFSPTITADNGQEFADHEHIAKELNTDVYFTHPYSSWKRATNENMNGLIRQYFPKKRSFATSTETEIELVMERLNNRPRKCFGFKSPNQVVFNHSPVVALGS